MTGPSFAFLVFDLDGVLLDFHPERRLARLAAITGLTPAFLQAAIWDSDFERSAEAGAWPDGEAYLAAFNARIGVAVTREQWIAARREAMTPRAAVIGYLRRLRERVPLALLTNNGALLLEALPQLCGDVTELFGDRLLASFQERGGGEEWLVVLRDEDDAADTAALMAAFRLTQKEAEVLYWVTKGKTNKDIGDILGTSPRTVNKHLEHVFEKLGVETRTAAANLAIGRLRGAG